MYKAYPLLLKRTTFYFLADVFPVSPGIIDNFTEVTIKPPSKHKQEDTKMSKNNSVVSEIHSEIEIFKKYHNQTPDLVLRLAPVNNFIKDIGQIYHPFNVFVFKAALQNNNNKNALDHPNIYLVTLLNQNDDAEKKPLFVRLYNLEEVIETKLNSIFPQSVFVSQEIINYFNCSLGSRLLLKPYVDTLHEISEIEIFTKNNYMFDVEQEFKQYLAQNAKCNEFILNSNIIFQIRDNLNCFLRFQPAQAKVCVVDKNFVRNCKLSVITEDLPNNNNNNMDELIPKSTIYVSNFEEIISNCVFLFTNKTTSFQSIPNVLITGIDIFFNFFHSICVI